VLFSFTRHLLTALLFLAANLINLWGVTSSFLRIKIGKKLSTIIFFSLYPFYFFAPDIPFSTYLSLLNKVGMRA